MLGMGKTKHESLGNINFKAAYDPDKGNLFDVFTKLLSSTTVGFHSQVLQFNKTNAVH